jgi:hypothetical protein
MNGFLQVSVLSALLSGCATQKAAISSEPGSSPMAHGGLHFDFRTAVLTQNSTPAAWSFQPAKGKLGTPREAFYDFAEIAVGGPTLSVLIPGKILGEVMPSASTYEQVVFLAAVSGAAGGLAAAGAAFVAPAVGAKGLVRSWKTLTREELTERETALESELKQIASQEHFQKLLLASADRRSPGRIVSIQQSMSDAILEARIEDLRLERKGSDEGSYFLRIKARVRLVRQSDETLIYEQRVEYRSGQALFLDWTYHGSVEGVALTGYRALADYFVNVMVN